MGGNPFPAVGHGFISIDWRDRIEFQVLTGADPQKYSPVQG